MDSILISAIENLGYAIGLVIVLTLYYIFNFVGNILGGWFQSSELDKIAWLAINAAEDAIDGEGKGRDRKEYAIEFAIQRAETLGIEVDPSWIDSFIRGTYNAFIEEIHRKRDERKNRPEDEP